ncbi:hypothetical protein CIP107529_00312 [Corynebacterium diphtheriae]|uniref:Uncharacterized protein n=1 Tax=Corynebacterium diphtheriae TaxID=1717 RepID=A0A811G0W8_CORDP|nr:hypothetical protein CIP107523_00186 [Corynebacterium diphtheriae]CAB0536110.1 hypothetical protein CIP107529_00312 [Corynebacterium diphtheriae]CAB0582930.1 hypothetical protein CIP107547_00334 [Corynebacterium diphtheriae]
MRTDLGESQLVDTRVSRDSNQLELDRLRQQLLALRSLGLNQAVVGLLVSGNVSIVFEVVDVQTSDLDNTVRFRDEGGRNLAILLTLYWSPGVLLFDVDLITGLVCR